MFSVCLREGRVGRLATIRRGETDQTGVVADEGIPECRGRSFLGGIDGFFLCRYARSAGPANIELGVSLEEVVSMPPFGGETLVAICPEGLEILGGGGKTNAGSVSLVKSFPFDALITGWSAVFLSDSEFDQDGVVLTAFAICADVE